MQKAYSKISVALVCNVIEMTGWFCFFSVSAFYTPIKDLNSYTFIKKEIQAPI